MLSAMTTSENFSLKSQPRCPAASYRSVARSGFGPSPMGDCYPSNVFDKPRGNGFGSGFPIMRDYCNATPEMKPTPGVCGGSSESVASEEVPKFEFENDISEWLEGLDLEDFVCEQSKPLKLDASVMKLDFSNFGPGPGGLGELYSRASRQEKRASHHLSGGGLLLDSSKDIFQSLSDAGSKSSICRLADAGCISTENIFAFDDLSYFEADECKPCNFTSQISPSSPLTFDLGSDPELKNIAKGKAKEGESTNPFNNIFYKEALDSKNRLPSTNPFTSPDFSSSPNRAPDYENLSVPQKSFSQCSTRPASPVTKTNGEEEPFVTNPFLLNQTSPQTSQSVSLGRFFLKDGRGAVAPLANPQNSFIFAVPVFPIFQHHQIANSSTQTGEAPESSQSSQEPVYQNVTNQLKKFMQWNNHSEYDLQCLKTTMKDLRNSGWYYENVSWQSSVVLLKNTEPGTFLIRDSSDPNFLFSLSVQTSRGPTSVRLHYVNGQFRLDAEEKLIPHMPSFNSVIELIDYYIENTVKNKFSNGCVKKSGKDKLQKSKEQVWIDAQGNVYSNILLVKPLRKKEHFSTLQHLVRLAINRHMKKSVNSRCRRLDFRVTPVYESSPFQDSSFPPSLDSFCPILNVDDLPLPMALINYLKDYPYCH